MAQFEQTIVCLDGEIIFPGLLYFPWLKASLTIMSWKISASFLGIVVPEIITLW
jgi:hypothetical protein